MSIDEKINIYESLFFRKLNDFKKYKTCRTFEELKFFYNLYNEYIFEKQEYIWYKGIETSQQYINELYNSLEKCK
jgi:hypothetical protein